MNLEPEMSLFNAKSLRRQPRRLSPHCRGGASSMLRLSGSATSGFCAFDRGGTVMQRLADQLPALASAAAAAAAGASPAPLYTRLWPSASFGSQALWQDTLVTLD
jgi:hypothetical protein